MRATHERRLAELRSKLSSLRIELDAWKKLTDDSPPLKRHQSQIRLLDATLTALLMPVDQALAAQPGEADIFEKGVGWENDILAAHSIWEVFRAKYVLRQNEIFRDYLAACDDLAWECYAPALKRFAPGALKEPPLVYLSATWSPFAQSRDTNFLNEVRATGGGLAKLGSEEFQQVLARLPIPLVSLPWYQLLHLPGAIIVAHEIGHVVERDFKLTDALIAALEGAGLANPEVWKAWASEVFADVYGCLAMGPTFAGSLMDLMTTARSTVANERRMSGAHPPRALRVEIVLTVLTETAYADEANRLRAAWEATYTRPHAMEDFVEDAKRAAKAVMHGPYSGAKLTDVVSFPKSATLANIRIFAAQGQAINLAPYSDPRELFAAAQMLHEEPLQNQKPNVFKLLVDQAIRRGANQYRSQGQVIEKKAQLDAELAAREKQARNDAEGLRTLLRELARQDH